MVYLPNKGNANFLPNKDGIREMLRINPLQRYYIYCLGELAWSQVNQADTSITYSSRNMFLYKGDCLAYLLQYDRRHTRQDLAGKSRIDGRCT